MATEVEREGRPESRLYPVIQIVPDIFSATDGAETSFGRRWGGDVFELSSEHLAALQAGQALALDVQNEYVVFLRLQAEADRKPERLGHGE